MYSIVKKFQKLPFLLIVVMLLLSVASPVFASIPEGGFPYGYYTYLLPTVPYGPLKITDLDSQYYYFIAKVDSVSNTSINTKDRYNYNESTSKWSLFQPGGAYGQSYNLSDARYVLALKSKSQTTPGFLDDFLGVPWVIKNGDSYTIHDIITNEFIGTPYLGDYIVYGPDYIQRSSISDFEISDKSYSLSEVKSMFLESNFDIVDSSGQLIHSAGGSVDYTGSVSISSPLSWLDYKDSSYLQSLDFTLSMSNLDSGFDYNKLKFEVFVDGVEYLNAGPNNPSWGSEYTMNMGIYSAAFNSDKTEYKLSVKGPVYHDKLQGSRLITVDAYYDGALISSDSTSWTYVQGFVDEDEDGLDDRTGRTYDEYVEGNTPPVADVDFDITDFNIKDLGSFLTDALSGIRSVFVAVWGIIPGELLGLCLAAATMYIILRILGR